MTTAPDPNSRADQYLAAERELFRTRQALVASKEELHAFFERALQRPSERGTALRLLLTLDPALSAPYFATLVDLASVPYADLDLAQEVVRRVPRSVIDAQLEPEIEKLLAREDADAQVYRTLGELARELKPSLLPQIIERARASTDPDIREAADDLSQN